MNIGSECAKWNAARYEQELDAKLANNLLTEEVAELFTANTLVDKLDACGDIAFVALGVLWKSGISTEELVNMLIHFPIDCEDSLDRLVSQSEAMDFLLTTDMDFDTNEEAVVTTYALICLYQVIPTFLFTVGLLHEYKAIVEAICISNNTKEVKGKTASDVKANIVKGSNYVPPTKDLIAIIERNMQ